MANRQPDYIEQQSAWHAFRTGVLYDYPPSAVLTWFLIATLGTAALAWALFSFALLPSSDQTELGFLILAGILGGYYAVRARAPKMMYIGGDLFIYAALFLHGLPGAILVAFVEAVSPASRSGSRLSARLMTPFNAAVGAFVMGAVYLTLRPLFATGVLLVDVAAPLTLAGVAGLGTNMVFDLALRAMKRGERFDFGRLLKDLAVSSMIPLVCGVLIALLSVLPGNMQLLAGCAVTVIVVLVALRRWAGAVTNLSDDADSARDPATGAYLRSAFVADVTEAARSADSSTYHFAVVCVAMDVASVSRTLGYAAGEEFLGVVHRRLRHTLRTADVIGRTGHDTLSVLIRNVEEPAMLRPIAQRLLACATRPVDLMGVRVSATGFVGAASRWATIDDGDDVLSAAERAAISAKALGAGNVVLYDEQPGRLSEDSQESLPFWAIGEDGMRKSPGSQRS